MSFQKAPTVDANVFTINGNNSLLIFDEENLRNNIPLVKLDQPSTHNQFKSSKNILIAYNCEFESYSMANFSVSLHSDIPYGDWTDTHRFFMRLEKDNKQKIASDKSYISENRKVENWIWGLFFSIGGLIFGITVIIFFIRPVNKMRNSLSFHDIAKDIKEHKHHND